MRVLEKSNNILTLENLGFHGANLKALDELSKENTESFTFQVQQDMEKPLHSLQCLIESTLQIK